MKDDSFKDFVVDQLQELDNVEARRMFGGYGIYRDEAFFGIIHKVKLYFKIDESTVGEYRRRKMKPFRPNAKRSKVIIKCLSKSLRTASNFASGAQGDSLPATAA